MREIAARKRAGKSCTISSRRRYYETEHRKKYGGKEVSTVLAKPKEMETILTVKDALGVAYIRQQRVGKELLFFAKDDKYDRNTPVAVQQKNGTLVFLVKQKRQASQSKKHPSRSFREARFIKECKTIARRIKSPAHVYHEVMEAFGKVPKIVEYTDSHIISHTPVMVMGGERKTHVLILHNDKMLPVKMDGEILPPRTHGNAQAQKSQFTSWIRGKAGNLGLVRHVLKKSLFGIELRKRTVKVDEEVQFAQSEDQLYARVKKTRGYTKTIGPSPYDSCKYVPVQEKPSTNTLLNQTVKCDGVDVSQVFDLVNAKAKFGCINQLGKLAHAEALEQVADSQKEAQEARDEVIRNASDRRAKRQGPRNAREQTSNKTSQKQDRKATVQKQKSRYAGAKSRSRGMRTNKGGKGKLNRSKNEGFSRKRNAPNSVPRAARRA